MTKTKPVQASTPRLYWLALAVVLLSTLLPPLNAAAQAADPQPQPQQSLPPDPQQGSSEYSSVSLSRTGADGKQRQITVTRMGSSDDTGIFAICSPRDSDPPSTPTVFVTSESTAGGIELRVDKNVIRAPLAVITRQADAGTSESSSADGHIEVSAGTARYLDTIPEGKTDRLSLCAVEATPTTRPDAVSVTQGRTQLRGQSLVYDESDGIVRISGPITFERSAAKGEALSGTSQSIEVDIDHETTTLVGDVVLRIGKRVSKAARVEYDDQANIAILYGTPQQPAQVQDGGDVIQAQRIRSNLDTGRVSAEGISGRFEVEEGGGAP